MKKHDANVFISPEHLSALQGDVMYANCPIAFISFNDGDPDIYARVMEYTKEQIQTWVMPDGIQIVNIPLMVFLYYLTPPFFLCGDVVGKEIAKIKSIQLLN